MGKPAVRWFGGIQILNIPCFNILIYLEKKLKKKKQQQNPLKGLVLSSNEGNAESSIWFEIPQHFAAFTLVPVQHLSHWKFQTLFPLFYS